MLHSRSGKIKPPGLGLVLIALLLSACGSEAAPTATATTPVVTTMAVTTTMAVPTTIPATTVAATSAPTTTTSAVATTTALTTNAPATTTVSSRLQTLLASCKPGSPVTVAQTEGPYYKANTPQRTSLLEPGIPGTKIVLAGFVLTRDCKPVKGAWLDFWQADGNGVYDNSGYKLRGHQTTAEDGSYYLETVVPGEYPGRTPHIHVKIQAPNQPVLTSQLYLPGLSSNQRDSIYNPALQMQIEDGPNGKMAYFNFVV